MPKDILRERLPSFEHVARIAKQTAQSALEARAYNETITPEDQEAFYLAGMNKIAERVWELARARKPNVEELRIYLELLLKHKEQTIKLQKTTVMLRHLELLERKRKLLEEAAKDRSLTDVQFYEKVRAIFDTVGNGADRDKKHDRPHRTGYNGAPTQEVRTIQLIENTLTP